MIIDRGPMDQRKIESRSDDTEETINDTIDFAMSLPLARAQFSVFCPYPGSEYFGRVMKPFTSVSEALSAFETFTSYPAFGGNKPIWSPEGLTPEMMVAFQKKAFRRFYWSPKTLLRPQLLRSMLRPRTMIDVMRAATDLVT